MPSLSDKAKLARSEAQILRLREEAQRLERELHALQRDLVNLPRYELSTILHGSYGCETRRDLFEWAELAADEIIELAARDLLKGPPDFLGEYRMPCPLCLQETRSFYPTGFKVPDGLKKHLLGEGNCHNTQCLIFKAAVALALERVDGLDSPRRTAVNRSDATDSVPPEEPSAKEEAPQVRRRRRGRPRLPPP